MTIPRYAARLGAYFLPEGDRDLRERFYEGLCLVGAVLAILVVIPVNAFQNLPVIISAFAFLFGVTAFALYLAARRGHYFPGLFFTALTITLNVGWFPNAGTHGSIAYYFFVLICYPVIFFRPPTRWVLASLVAVNLFGLMLAEYLVPRLVHPFASDSDRLLDLSTGFLVSGLACVLMLWVLTTGYGRERERLRVTVAAEIEAKKAVAESRAILATLIDGTDDLVWLVDPAGFKLTAYNAAFAAAARGSFGADVTIGMGIDAFMSPVLAEEWRGFYQRALGEGPFTIEYRLPGQRQVMLHSFNAVRHGDVTTGVVVVGKDITQLKLAEARREQLELELFEAQKLESLGSLAGGVAHEFNNMLGGIIGYADMLLEEETDARRREYLEAILQAANRSSDLTRKLLAVGRRGKNIVEAVDLNTLARDGVAMLRPSFRQNVRVDLELGATWTVDGDPSQLTQVIVNLCMNANEAMRDGGTLTVRSADVIFDATTVPARDLAPGPFVELQVADSGIGMTEEVKTRIFEPFFTTKPRSGSPGTGLGLSTVYGIVHLHHGSISVVSAPGQGAHFTVYLQKGTLTTQTLQTKSDAGAGHGLVLIVEDEAALRKLAGAALHKLGYESVAAADGQEGIEVFRARHGELFGVLLDLKMPRLDGRNAFLGFQQIDPSVPVLICSGYGDNAEAQELISLGARGLLAKPYRLSTLGERLAELRPATAVLQAQG